MRGHYLTILSFLLLLPQAAFALCTSNGATIVYVNGIETSYIDAQNDLFKFQEKFIENGGDKSISFRNGYNQTHLNGIADLIQSVTQTFHHPISNYDRDTILNQIYPEVTTQKILLVGHSQGTFYTNELYEYLTKNGVPPQAIAVYNLATPADHVAGGGAHLTSANDRAIETIREIDAESGAPQALAANIIIPREPGWVESGWGGHSFAGAYLAGKPERIVSDIDTALSKLSSAGTDANGGCFTPPGESVGYKTQAVLFVAGDPLIHTTAPVVEKVASGVASVASAAHGTMASFANFINTAIGTTYYSIFPRPNVQNATAAFGIAKALYGSSLNREEYEALLTDNPLPEKLTAQQQTQTPARDETVSEAPIASAPSVPPPDSALPQMPTAEPLSPVPAQGGIAPGFGGGGGGGPIAETKTVQSSPTPTSEVHDEAPVSIATSSVLALAVLSPDENASLATTSVAFTGTTSPKALVLANFGTTTVSTNADESGNWSMAFLLSEGTTTVSFSALDATNTKSSTSTRTIGISLPVSQVPSEPLPPVLQSITQTPCVRPALVADGYFFSVEKDEAGYAADGYLEYHFKLLLPYQDGRTFKLFWNYYNDECQPTGPITSRPSISFGLPPGHTNWSIRFTTPTHFEVHDDDATSTPVIIANVDTAALPSYTSIEFAGTIDGNASTFAARGLKIDQKGTAPQFSNTVAPAQECSANDSSYLFDGAYERAEYVNGLLRLHLRLKTPYNDGRGFRYLVLAGNNCSALRGIWWGDIRSGATIPAYERYFSLRMASSTHWILWDDERDVSIAAEEDIADNSGYVRFYGVIDIDSSFLSNAYPPVAS